MATWRHPLPLLAVASILIVSASSELLKLKSNPFGNFAIGFEKGFINSGKYSVIVPEGDVERRRTVMIRGPGVRDSVDMVFNTHIMVFSDWSGLFMLGNKVYSDTFGTLYYTRQDHKCTKKVYQKQSGVIVVVDSQTIDKEKCDAIRAKVESALHNYLEEPYKFLRPKAPPELRASPGFPGGDYVTGVLYGNFTCGQHNVELPAGDIDKERKVKISGPGVQDEIKMKVDLHSKMYGSWDGHFYLADKVFSVEPKTLVVEKDDGSCIKKFYGAEGSNIVVEHQILLKQEDCFVIMSGVFAALQKHIEPSSLSSDDRKELEDLEKKNKQNQPNKQSGQVKQGGIPIQVSSTVVMPKRSQYLPVNLRSGNDKVHNIEHPVFKSLQEHFPQFKNTGDDGIVNIQTNDVDVEGDEPVSNIQTNDVYVPATEMHDGQFPVTVKPDSLVKSRQGLYSNGQISHIVPNDLESEEDSEEGEYYYVPVDALEDPDDAVFLPPDDLQPLQGVPSEKGFERSMSTNSRSFQSDNPGQQMMFPEGLNRVARSIRLEDDAPEQGQIRNVQNNHVDLDEPGEVSNVQKNDVEVEDRQDQYDISPKLIRIGRNTQNDELRTDYRFNHPEELTKNDAHNKVANIQTNDVELDQNAPVTNIQTNKVDEEVDLAAEEQLDDIDPSHGLAHLNELERTRRGSNGGEKGGINQYRRKRSIYLKSLPHNIQAYRLSYSPKHAQHLRNHPHSQPVQNIQTNKVDVDENEEVSNIQTNVVNEHEDGVERGHRIEKGSYLTYAPFEVQRFRQESGVVDNTQGNKIDSHSRGNYIQANVKGRGGRLYSQNIDVQNVQTNNVDVDGQETVSNIQTNDVNEHSRGRKKRDTYLLPPRLDQKIENIQTNKVDIDGEESVANVQTNEVNEASTQTLARFERSSDRYTHPDVLNNQINNIDASEGFPNPDQRDFISVQRNNMLDPEDVKATQVTRVTLPENSEPSQTKLNPMYINTKILLNQGNDDPLYVRAPLDQGYIVDSHGRVLHVAKGPLRRPVRFMRLKKIRGHALSHKPKLITSEDFSKELSTEGPSGVLQTLNNKGKLRANSNVNNKLRKFVLDSKERKKLAYIDSSDYNKDPTLQVNVDNVDGSTIVSNLLGKGSSDRSKPSEKDKSKDSSGHIPMSFMKDLKELKDIYNPDKLIVNIAQNTNFEKLKK